LTPTGSLSFTVPSVAPANTSFEQWSISGLPTGTGVWATWYQYNSPSSSDLLLQRFTGAGASGLDGGADNGVVAASLTTTTPSPQLISDGAGGVVEVWFDAPSGVNSIYAQRFGANGAPKWGTNPVLISSAGTTPVTPDGYLGDFRVVATPDQNVAIFWVGTPNGIFAQKIDMASGAIQWGTFARGIQVSAATSVSWIDATFASDDSAYVAYQLGNDVFVKHVEPGGTLGTTPVSVDAGPSGEGGAYDGGADAEAGTAEDGGTDTGAGGADSAADTSTAGEDSGTSSADAHVGEDSGGARPYRLRLRRLRLRRVRAERRRRDDWDVLRVRLQDPKRSEHEPPLAARRSRPPRPRGRPPAPATCRRAPRLTSSEKGVLSAALG
jgi:hypothetical protein